MATASAKQIEELLECSICTETLTQPRTLSCFHSFCKHCLASFVATKKEAVKKGAKVPEIFGCPVCRSEFRVKEGESIENMPSNHFINNMLELLNLSQESQNISCQSCKARNPATRRCVSCENYLCKKCLEVHNNWPAFEDHIVLTLEELAKPENRAKARSKPRCEKHNKVLKFYCETCEVLVCRYCVDVNHARLQHLWFPLEDIIEQHKKAFLASSAIFEQQVNEAAQSSLNIKHAMSNLLHNATKAKDAIIQQQQEILSAFTKQLEQETATLLDKVDMKYKEANGLLAKQQTDVKDYLEKTKSSLDFVKNVFSNASNEELLSFKHEVEQKARTIKNERPKFMEPIHNGFFAYKAKQSKDILENIKLNDLGKIGMCTLFFIFTNNFVVATGVMLATG